MKLPLSQSAKSLADAAIRVIVRDGLDVLSVRTVAAAAGVSAGAVQYQLGKRDDILRAAFLRSIQRQEQRVEEARSSGEEALIQLLPVTEVSREDAAIWVIYGAAASTRQWLAELYNQVLGEFRTAVELRLSKRQLVDGLDVETGARIITALVNGLTLDGLSDPLATPERLRADLHRGLGMVIADF